MVFDPKYMKLEKPKEKYDIKRPIIITLCAASFCIFLYLLVLGNGNNFLSLKDCLGACKPKVNSGKI
jgi:hypothetical protein